jgi:hypothetical protein
MTDVFSYHTIFAVSQWIKLGAIPVNAMHAAI